MYMYLKAIMKRTNKARICSWAQHLTSKKASYEAAEARLRELRKFVQHERAEHGIGAAVALKVPYDDLAHADERGRWWVVGGRWTHEEGRLLKEGGSGTDDGISLALRKASPRLLESARVQGMHTDARKVRSENRTAS